MHIYLYIQSAVCTTEYAISFNVPMTRRVQYQYYYYNPVCPTATKTPKSPGRKSQEQRGKKTPPSKISTMVRL